MLTALACAAFVALGHWQAGKAQEKRAAARQTQSIVVAGEFVPEHTVLLDNKLRHGHVGYEVVTPLRLSGAGDYVLVNRGWLPAPARREQLPEVRTPSGQVRIEGVALPRFPRTLLAGPDDKGRVRQNLDIAQFAAETGLALRPMVVQESAGPDGGLVREWPAPGTGMEKNESYSLQWYSFAVLALLLFIALSFRRVAES